MILYCVIGFVVFCLMRVGLSIGGSYKDPIGDVVLSLLVAVFWPGTVPVVIYYAFFSRDE